jgi:uncharacterized phage-associated protein
MIVNRQQAKAIHAIIFFTRNTSVCFKKKLFKLLYLLDSEHFQKTGRSVTEFEYAAFPMGPVPVVLHEQMVAGKGELIENFSIIREYLGTNDEGSDIEGISLEGKIEFEPKYFSDRQLELLNNLCDRFYLSTGKEMEEFTHKEEFAWYRVWRHGKGNREKIPYELVLDLLPSDEKEAVLTIAQERQVFLENYQ